MQNNEVLKIDDLDFFYIEDNYIYKDFSLALKKGELFTIFGKSGSGKTTLFELIQGNLKAKKGKIQNKKLSLIFQDPYNSFHPSFTVFEQIKDVVDKNSLKDKNIYLEQLHLKEEILERKPHELSGGQLQRCSILRALLMKPELLLVDEPTSALDNIVAYDVMKLLIKYLDKCGILLITHDINLASWASDKIIRLENNDRNK